MSQFEIRVENANALAQAFSRYPQIATPVLQKALRGTEFAFQKHTLRNNPVPWRTGNLLQSFRFSEYPFRAEWRPTAHYAAHVEYGTRPHVILPRRAMALSWTGGGQTGRYVVSRSGKQYYKAGNQGDRFFAKRVNHPGSRARPYMGKILSSSKGDIEELFQQAGDIIIREIARLSR